MAFQTFTARQYLKIDIANSYGLDKTSWNDRISWFDAHEDQLDEMISSAKEPAMFFAGVKAWKEVKAGNPTGYMISLDATASGLQLLAVLTGDIHAAQLCNVVNTGTREDCYTKVYETMLWQIGDSAKITRDDTKQAIMTALYSSTAVPKRVFGEGALLDIFYGTMKTVAPAAWELNEAMLGFWDPNTLEHSWILPDNFHAKIKVMAQVRDTIHFENEPFDVFYNVNMPQPEGRSLGANLTHSVDGMIVRELTRRCDYDMARVSKLYADIVGPRSFGFSKTTDDDHMVITLWDRYLTSGYLSARILDHLVPENLGHVDPDIILELIDSLPARPFKVASIHDAFRCHPNYGNDLRKQYANQLMLIAKSNLLSFLLSQIAGRNIVINKLEPTMYQQIPHTNYALS